MKDISPNYEKILFSLPINHWIGIENETLWAEEIENGIYIIKNIPFYIKNLAIEDIVEAKVNEKDNLEFVKLIKHSGNSTYRVFALNEDILFYLEILLNKGCSYEKATENFYAINIPISTNIQDAYEILNLARDKNIIDFEEGFCGQCPKSN